MSNNRVAGAFTSLQWSVLLKINSELRTSSSMDDLTMQQTGSGDDEGDNNTYFESTTLSLQSVVNDGIRRTPENPPNPQESMVECQKCLMEQK
jgi:hypothetical protein